MLEKGRGYNLPKALCIRERTHRVIKYEGRYRITIQQRTWWSTKDMMWVSVLNQKRKECKCNRLWDHLNNSKLKCKGIMIPNQRIRSRRSDQGWINWIYQRHNRWQIVWSRTSSCLKDVWAGEIFKRINWWLCAFATYWVNRLKMIMTRNVNKITKLMGLTIIQASENFKSNRLLRIFGIPGGILKTFV